MATLVLSTIAKNAGWNAFWSSVAVGVGTMIDQSLFGPKTTVEGSRLSDLSLQSSAYGIAIPYIYGTTRVAGNIIWGTNFVEHKHSETHGGKGGGGSSTTNTYDYSVSFAVSICRGPITSINKVWADGKLIDFTKRMAYAVDYSKITGYPADMTNYSRAKAVTVAVSNVDALSPEKWHLYWDATQKNWSVIGDIHGNVGRCPHGGSFSNEWISLSVATQYTDTYFVQNDEIVVDVYGHVGTAANVHYGTEDQLPDEFIESIEGVGNVPAYRGQAYVVFKNFYVTDFGNRIPNLTFEVTTGTSDLPDILYQIKTNAGLPDAQCDLSGVQGISVPGFTVSGSTYREQIEQLQSVYLFDGVERNGKVYFATRDFSTAVEVTEDDLGTYESESGDAYKITRTPERELPKTLTLTYIASDNDFQQATVSRSRQNVESRSENSVSTNLVMDGAWAKEAAETLLYEAWTARTAYELVLPHKFAHLTPGVILHLNFPNRQPYCIVTKTSYGAPGMVKVAAQDVGKTTFLQVGRAVDPGTSADFGGLASPVYYEFLDIPRLPADTLSDDEHIYFAANADRYYGARVFKESADAEYATVLSYAPASPIGKAVTVLPTSQHYCFDNDSIVDILLYEGTLSSKTKADVLNWANAAVLGDEIIQFMTATLIGENTYRLSGLLRGRAGTEEAMASHVANERFVLLDKTYLRTIPVLRPDWYMPKNYKVGQSTATADSDIVKDITFTAQGVSALPYSVCHVRGERNSSGDLTITWRRRTRGDGTWKDNSDVPLSETFEKYEIDILSSGAVKRTISSDTASIVYTVVEQVADFGSQQSAVTVAIYQLSESRGRGRKREVTL